MHSRFMTASTLALAVLAASVGTSAANVALPTIAATLEVTPAQTQWVVVAYLLTMTATSVVAGAAGDRWGRRRVLLAGLGLFTASAVGSAISPTVSTLAIARGVQGIGAAFMTTLPLALARDLAVAGRTGRIMGLLGTTSAVGTALGPAGGGALIVWGGWTAPFWAMTMLGMVTLLLCFLAPAPAASNPDAREFHYRAAVLLTAVIATYALALTAPAPDWPTVPLLTAAAALLLTLIAVERRATTPLLPLAALGSRSIAVGILSNLLVATVMMTTLVVGPYALHDGLGLPFVLVGFVMAVGPITSAISGVVAGRLVDRSSPPRMVRLGLGLMTLGATALALLPTWWSTAGYVAALMILTPGYQLFLAANNTHMLAVTDTTVGGTVAGVLSLSRNLGLITGASVMGGLYASLTATAHADPSMHLHAMRVTFLVAALLALVAALSSSSAFARIGRGASLNPQ